MTSIDKQIEVLTFGLAEVLPAGGLVTRLRKAEAEGTPLRVKLGIDPSGSELTLGHAVVLRKLRQFQDFGHTAVLVVGGFTGRVGDPTDRSALRSSLSAEEASSNAQQHLEQFMRVLSAENLEVVNNADWLGTMTLQPFFEAISVATVSQILQRDDFANRMASNKPISLPEFLYPLLQGYDSVAIRSDVELGGSDQTFNNLVGRTLQKSADQEPQVVATVPLLVGTDGVQKMGKSLDNWIGIREAPSEQFGKLMSIPDFVVRDYAILCASFSDAQVAALEHQMEAKPAEAKRDVAQAIVSLYHGAAAAVEAREGFDKRFRLKQLPTEAVPEHHTALRGTKLIVDLLVEAELSSSRSEARRLIKQGGIRLNGMKCDDTDQAFTASELEGALLQRGKLRAVRVRPIDK